MASAGRMHYTRTSHPFSRIRRARGHFCPGVLPDPYARERERERASESERERERVRGEGSSLTHSPVERKRVCGHSLIV